MQGRDAVTLLPECHASLHLTRERESTSKYTQIHIIQFSFSGIVLIHSSKYHDININRKTSKGGHLIGNLIIWAHKEYVSLGFASNIIFKPHRSLLLVI